MKLATLRDGSRDGRLIVVSRDLSRAAPVPQVKTLQDVLDDWEAIAPDLELLSQKLNEGRVAGTLAFDPADCLSPLPRAYQRIEGAAYPSHLERLQRARGGASPESPGNRQPLIRQRGSDSFLAPRDAIPLLDEAWGLDLEAGVAVITGDVPMAAGGARVAQAVRLVMLVNGISLRHLAAHAGTGGVGFQASPSAAFSPCAVTPDELDAHWDGSHLHRRLQVQVNGRLLGEPDAGRDLQFGFPQLLVHAARTRLLVAGTIVGGGAVSNRDAGCGYSSLAELRAAETLQHGQPQTPYLVDGDRIRIEVLDEQGASIFGAIEQPVRALR